MKNRLVNIMPMAGEGKRFKEAGYKTPKPLININGEHMFIKSAKCMPETDLWIFIVREEFLNNKLFKEQIKKNFKNYEIISVKKTTEGQASTCYLAKKYLKQNDQIFISSCDNYFEFDYKDFIDKSNKHDLLVFTTNSKKINIENPNLFGWVKINENKKIEISCKKQISPNPVNDRIIVGSFFFKNLFFFDKSIQSLFEKNKKINNEYYLDMAISEAISLNLNVGEIIIKNYVSWGSSKELEESSKKKL
tara:strand:- start:1784 stop:2530 length:747 start_codon:yes stop_codon:yes gene_type:complete